MIAYRIFLTLHVLSAIVWVGGAIWIELFFTRALRAEDPSRLAGLGADAAWAGKAIFPAAALATLIFGLGAVATGKVGWPLWIITGLVIVGITIILGIGILAPTSKKLEKVSASKGLADPQAQALMKKIRSVSHVNTVLLILAVLAMTLKPRL